MHIKIISIQCPFENVFAYWEMVSVCSAASWLRSGTYIHTYIQFHHISTHYISMRLCLYFFLAILFDFMSVHLTVLCPFFLVPKHSFSLLLSICALTATIHSSGCHKICYVICFSLFLLFLLLFLVFHYGCHRSCLLAVIEFSQLPWFQVQHLLCPPQYAQTNTHTGRYRKAIDLFLLLFVLVIGIFNGSMFAKWQVFCFVLPGAV